jgi:hypothetical protein
VNNEALEVRNDVVTLELGISTYALSSFVRVGEGGNGQLTLHGNTVEVFDFTEVGGNGIGLLRIEGGADWITHNLGVGGGAAGATGLIVSGSRSSLQQPDCCDMGICSGTGNVGSCPLKTAQP